MPPGSPGKTWLFHGVSNARNNIFIINCIMRLLVLAKISLASIFVPARDGKANIKACIWLRHTIANADWGIRICPAIAKRPPFRVKSCPRQILTE